MQPQIWDDIIKYSLSKGIIDEYSYNIWFKDLSVDIKNEKIIVRFPSKIIKDKFESSFFPQIKEALKEFNGVAPEFVFSVRKTKERKKDGDYKKCENGENNINKSKIQRGNSIKTSSTNKKNTYYRKNNKLEHTFFEYNQVDNLNPRYTFENFVIGKNNEFCAAAAQRVAKYPGQNFNPLFIYGGYGLGKTHILQAIAKYIVTHYPEKNVVYMPVDQFINEFIYALQNKQMEFFRLKYRNADVLLLDDIQFLEKKDASMEEFFHTFNILHQSQKQMVFTCDKPPKDLKDFEDRVRNRMEWGLTVSITQPDFETRIAILNKKAELEKREVNPDIINFIAKNVKSSIRELESALIKIFAYCDIFNINAKEITLEQAKDILKDQLKYFNESRIIQVEDIIRRVAEVFKVSTVDIKSKKRNRSISLARNVAMFIARELTPTSTTEIGLSFGGKDHTTIIHASNKISQLIKEDDILKATIESIMKDLKS